jgi:hypothetical protein
MKFGGILRELRTQPERVSNERIAEHFEYDRAKLMLSAGKVPEEIVQILQSHPEEAIRMLRERFADRAKRSIS